MFCVIVSMSLELEYMVLSSAYRAISVFFVVGKLNTYRKNSV